MAEISGELAPRRVRVEKKEKVAKKRQAVVDLIASEEADSAAPKAEVVEATGAPAAEPKAEVVAATGASPAEPAAAPQASAAEPAAAPVAETKKEEPLDFLNKLDNTIFTPPNFTGPAVSSNSSKNRGISQIAPSNVLLAQKRTLLEKPDDTFAAFADYLLKCDSLECFLHRLGFYKISFFQNDKNQLNENSLSFKLMNALLYNLMQTQGDAPNAEKLNVRSKILAELLSTDLAKDVLDKIRSKETSYAKVQSGPVNITKGPFRVGGVLLELAAKYIKKNKRKFAVTAVISSGDADSTAPLPAPPSIKMTSWILTDKDSSGDCFFISIAGAAQDHINPTVWPRFKEVFGITVDKFDINNALKRSEIALKIRDAIIRSLVSDSEENKETFAFFKTSGLQHNETKPLGPIVDFITNPKHEALPKTVPNIVKSLQRNHQVKADKEMEAARLLLEVQTDNGKLSNDQIRSNISNALALIITHPKAWATGYVVMLASKMLKKKNIIIEENFNTDVPVKDADTENGMDILQIWYDNNTHYKYFRRPTGYVKRELSKAELIKLTNSSGLSNVTRKNYVKNLVRQLEAKLEQHLVKNTIAGREVVIKDLYKANQKQPFILIPPENLIKILDALVPNKHRDITIDDFNKLNTNLIVFSAGGKHDEKSIFPEGTMFNFDQKFGREEKQKGVESAKKQSLVIYPDFKPMPLLISDNKIILIIDSDEENNPIYILTTSTILSKNRDMFPLTKKAQIFSPQSESLVNSPEIKARHKFEKFEKYTEYKDSLPSLESELAKARQDLTEYQALPATEKNPSIEKVKQQTVTLLETKLTELQRSIATLEGEIRKPIKPSIIFGAKAKAGGSRKSKTLKKNRRAK